MTLLMLALDRVKLETAFAADPYESRRSSLPGAKLLKVLVVYQLIKSPSLRGLVDVIATHSGLQKLLGGVVPRNTLSNALQERELDQMVEAWLLVLQEFAPWVARLGKKFARIAVVDASLIKLSLAAFDWAAYRKKTGAAKLTIALDWARRIPQQLVVTVGKAHDLCGAAQLSFLPYWTYVFDRGYVSFDFLRQVLAAGAHFVVRFKQGISYQIEAVRPVLAAPTTTGLTLLSDWTISLAGWVGVPLRLVSYQLPDGRVVRVLTDRFDLTALSVAQLYKERWTVELWFKWLKQMFKVKTPLGRSEQALPLQLVGAFVTDLLLRAFKQSSGFTSSLYEFVRRCQELSLTPLSQLVDGPFRRALETVARLLTDTKAPLQLIA